MTFLALQVEADGDNGFCSTAPAFSTTTTLIIGHNGTNFHENFVRFTGVTIPMGSTIDDAKLIFTSRYQRNPDTVRVAYKCCAADNPAAPINCAELTALTRTTAERRTGFNLNWAPDTEYDSPDFASAVQEVIDRGGWSSGNALIVIIEEGYVDKESDFGAYRQAYDHNEDNTKATKIEINYTPPPTRGSPIFF